MTWNPFVSWRLYFGQGSYDSHCASTEEPPTWKLLHACCLASTVTYTITTFMATPCVPNIGKGKAQIERPKKNIKNKGHCLSESESSTCRIQTYYVAVTAFREHDRFLDLLVHHHRELFHRGWPSSLGVHGADAGRMSHCRMVPREWVPPIIPRWSNLHLGKARLFVNPHLRLHFTTRRFAMSVFCLRLAGARSQKSGIVV